jgi:hypothetical protein
MLILWYLTETELKQAPVDTYVKLIVVCLNGVGGLSSDKKDILFIENKL